MAPLPPTREQPTVLITPGGPGSPYPPGGHGPGARRRARRVLKLLFFAIAIMIALGMGAVVAGLWIGKQAVDDLVTPKSAEVRDAQKQLEAALPGKSANLLIMGSDYRTGFDAGDRRSDTLLMVRLDPQNQTISMISFPRDLYVDIPGHGQAKINDAFTLGGPELTVLTVKQLTGLDVNFISVVDFKGFRGIVDKLGGVYVDVDHRYYNPPNSGYAEIDIQPGYQLLRGKDALAFARFRHTDSDFHRIARQQQLLAALKKQVSGTKVAQNLRGLFKVLHTNTDMATGGNGKISTRQVIDYMRLGLKLRGHSIYQVEVSGAVSMTDAGASIVVADPTIISAAVDAFMHPNRDAQATTADQVTGQKPGAAGGVKLPPPARVRIEVRNGNGIDGSATNMATALRGLEYNVLLKAGPAANADRQSYASTRVQYRADRDRALAQSVADRFEGATVEKMTPANPFRTRLLVIVGKTSSLAGNLAAGSTVESNRVPTKAPARVTIDSQYGLDDFQTIRGKVRFPLMYPTVRETSSLYDVDEGVRTYKVARGQSVYDAYRLVAKTGAGDYWGLQGTNWPDPPLLDDPTRELTKGGRTYLLFFNGTRLHMVAWRQGGGVYWVTNSVLDKLGNETMLAIAQGVKRLPRLPQ